MSTKIYLYKFQTPFIHILEFGSIKRARLSTIVPMKHKALFGLPEKTRTNEVIFPTYKQMIIPKLGRRGTFIIQKVHQLK